MRVDISAPGRASLRLPAMAVVMTILAGCTTGGGLGGFGKLGNFGFGREEKADPVADQQQTEEEFAALQRLVGTTYCPEIRIRPGRQNVRRYAKGFEDDPGYVTWQASIHETARECIYDTQGNLNLKIGVSGRILSGPKAVQGPVSIPLRIEVEKYQEGTLSAADFTVDATIGAPPSSPFSQVYAVTVPSPSGGRNYFIYVALGTGEEDSD